MRGASDLFAVLGLALVLVAAGGAAPLRAQEESASGTRPGTGTPADEIRDIEALRSDLRGALRAAQDGDDETGSRRGALLREIDRVTTDALQAARDLARPADVPDDVEPEATASLARLAALEDEIRADRSRLDDLRAALAASREARLQAEEGREVAARAARRAARSDGEDAETTELARLEATAAAERARLATLQERQTRRSLDALSENVARLESRIATLRSTLQQSDEPFDASFLGDREEALRRRLEAVARRRASLDLQVEAASERYRRRAEPSPDLLAAVERLRAVRDLTARQESILQDRLDAIETEEDLWRRWHRVVTRRADDEQLVDWVDEAVASGSALRRERARAQGELAALRESIDAARGRAEAADPDTAVRERLAALQETEQLTLAQIDELERTIRLAARLEADAEQRLGVVSIGKRLGRVWSSVSDVFSTELTSVDDQPITVGKALTALLLLIAGVVASGRGSRALAHVLQRRGIEPGLAGAIQTGVFYLLLMSFTLFALNLVNFPLTAFTVAGGALAIGIGFGSQNVLNNFISGLILMFERPVRSHDLVEVEGTHGTIERIGLRSTRIRAQDGRYIVVPNSFFLESNVVNWTLSDELIRGKLVVGVVYGSDTARVHALLTETLRANPGVLNDPAPVINFANFGDNSLDFHVFFWTRSRTPMGIERVMSELRYEIDRLFREAEIVIAFPQRDVHLDSTTPVQIALVEPRAARRDERDGEGEEER
jgi:small-conductance mechanosensitive channel